MEEEKRIQKNLKSDQLILGGREFSSRFILGSGKYNVEMIRAEVDQAGAEIITLAVRPPAPEPLKKQCELQGCPESLAAGIL